MSLEHQDVGSSEPLKEEANCSIFSVSFLRHKSRTPTKSVKLVQLEVEIIKSYMTSVTPVYIFRGLVQIFLAKFENC